MLVCRISPKREDAHFRKSSILLNKSSFQLQGYPRETAIAEKFQAMVALGIVNDRMKDCYDIWILSAQANISGQTLVEALRATFQARKTALPNELPAAFSDEFIREKQGDWKRFVSRFAGVEETPSLEQVIIQLRKFLLPPVEAALKGADFDFLWEAGKSWVKNR